MKQGYGTLHVLALVTRRAAMRMITFVIQVEVQWSAASRSKA